MNRDEIIALLPAWMRPRGNEVLYYYEGELLRRYSPDQPRDDHGRWTDEGNTQVADAGNIKTDANVDGGSGLSQAPNEATQNRAEAIYGETGGLTPQLVNPDKNPYNSSNWDSDSMDQLEMARTYIGIVSERNPDVYSDTPSDSSNTIQAQTWNLSMNAAVNGADSTQLNPQITNFFLRQDGVGRQNPNWGLTLYISLGPFNNVGGGDVPKGPNTYIDFYGK